MENTGAASLFRRVRSVTAMKRATRDQASR